MRAVQPPRWRAIGLHVLASLAVFVSSCTPQARAALASDVLKITECVISNQDKPDAEVIAACAAANVTPDDIIRILSSTREQTKKAARKLGACPP